MKTIDIYGENYAGHTDHVRAGSRGIVLRDGKLLLSHETLIDQWMIPGGGVEEGETPAQACIRELAEETGLLVKPGDMFLTLNEYYEDWLFIGYYFVCTVQGECERNPTRRELEVGAEPEWLPMEDALSIFSRHADWTDVDEMRRGMYQREYTALQVYQAMQANEKEEE